jgi:16S rRNA (guanine527-N7)-methyltransferase
MDNRQPLIQTFLEKNTHINLSAIRDEEGVLIKHIQDSLEINKMLTFPVDSTIADIGTGGGFPLMPLAMTNLQAQFTGIDSVKKKTLAVNEMIAELGITNAKVLRTRIEDFKGSTFDYITARAVAYVDKLIPWAYHLLKKGGKFILMKQRNEEEKAVLLQISKKWNLKLVKEHYYTLFKGDIERVIYVIEKG